jgi:LacI family transcriptional regulator
MTLKKRRLPTLEDVAAAAAVSTATVSRSLNEPDKVSEHTRIRVMDAVNQLRYSPNFGARAIAANRTGIFGAVIPTMENSIFARGIEAFQKALVAKGKTMIVASSGYDVEQEVAQIRTLVARGADGMLLIGTARDPDLYSFLNERQIPTVIAWAKADNNQHSYVGFDNKAASKEMVGKALVLGHRSFAFISAKTAMNDRARDRVSGAQQALAEDGIDVASMAVIETDYSIQCGRDAFVEVNQLKPRPTVVICGNDVLAVGAVKAAQGLGLHVPNDVSITGFDDIELASVVSPGLTTVHVPHRNMGRIAAETLMSLVDDPGVVRQTVLETYIVERESLDAPRAA